MIYTDEIGKRKIRDDIVGRSGRISGYMYSVVGGVVSHVGGGRGTGAKYPIERKNQWESPPGTD